MIWTKGDETSQRRSLIIGMGIFGLFAVMMFSFPLTRTASPILLGVYLGLLSAVASLSLSSKAEKRMAFNPAVFATLLLLSVIGTYFGYREISGWHHASLAKVIGQMVFLSGDNNPYANRENMLLLAEHTDKAMSLEPYAPILLRDSFLSYTDLSLKIGDEKLAEIFRNKALETAKRHLSMSPNDIYTHKIVATRLQVSNDVAMEHIGKAIELNPDDLQLYEYIKSFTLPTKQFNQALTYFEYYIPRFYNQKMNEDYAHIGKQAKQEERVIDILASIDLSRKYSLGSVEYAAEKKKLEQLIEDLQQDL